MGIMGRSQLLGYFCLLLPALISSIMSEPMKDTDTVQFVTAVFRHGDRYPSAAEYNLLWGHIKEWNETKHPDGLGALTTEGKRTIYRLGVKLRERYNNFLSDVYNPNDIEARSTDIPRAKMSLNLVLAGLYPPAKSQQWHPDINWQPIATTSVPIAQDDFFVPIVASNRYIEEYNRVVALPEIKREIEKFRPVMDNLTNILGTPVDRLFQLWFVYNGLMASTEIVKTLPEWSHEFYPKGPLFDATILGYQLFNYNDLMIKYTAGSILKKITEDMVAVANGSSSKPRKINLFSCHDVNVVALLKALDLYEPHIPEYSSGIIIELVLRDDEYYVKVVRYLGKSGKFEERQLPNCGKLCRLEDFIKLVDKISPSNYEDKELTTETTQESNNLSDASKIKINQF